MEERIRRLEQEVQKLNAELARIREFVNMPAPETAQGDGDFGPDQKELMGVLKAAGAPGRVLPMEKLRRKMGWDTRRFEDAVTGLARRGAAVLHESDTLSMSLSSMKEGVIGDDGRMFTGLSLS